MRCPFQWDVIRMYTMMVEQEPGTNNINIYTIELETGKEPGRDPKERPEEKSAVKKYVMDLSRLGILFG
jgi:hypothetical protein